MKGKLQNIHPLGMTIIIGTLFARFATSMSIPFLAIYLTTVKDVSAGMTGAIIGTSALVGVFASFIGGNLSDRFGRKMIIIWSMIVWVFVFIGFSVADHVLSFFLLNALNGLCRSFFEPTSRALLSDLTKPEYRLLVYNLRYGAINVGVAIGPIVGLQLGSAKSTIPFLVAAGVYILYTAILALQFKKYPLNKKKMNTENPVTMLNAIRILRKDVVFLVALVGIILSNSGFSHLTTTVSQYFANAHIFQDGVKLFSYMLALNAIVVVVIQYPVIQMCKKYTPLASIMVGTLFVSGGLFGFGLVESMLGAAICTIIFTFGEVLMFSMTDVFIDEIADSNLKGTYFGAMGFSGIGGVIGPWFGGVLLDYYGYQNGFVVFLALALFSTVAFPVLLVTKGLLKKRYDRNYNIEIQVK
ncbi:MULTISPECIES: MDR family MFS transporter [Bacillus]|uniref:MFS transporter n=4 Tax=Bacillaceae TaxID=186817 RepID=A0A2B5BRX3_9BACI|nr:MULTISPECIES: MFS transporter [Bacillus]EEL21831.1 Transporter, MFS superfamily [Bacillus cereus Rock1-3]EEL33380.1 Transporter, MFS superfamily [Bacillus cereus Rock3-28]EEL39184.1 Transporter, MFS superfamily [Bacillus cereus Rock3-29]EEL59794.1 Acetyl-CoA acetyltransferase [Bacillus cereus Rock4-18]EOP24085.1 multidrug resistance protein B [Bacillus cereus VD131]KAB0445859.1 MFS transporter [Lysinibacillus sp. VIA-II-2016]KNH41689.1 MFS transporter [Bacillus thuringiensis]KXY11730.1 M